MSALQASERFDFCSRYALGVDEPLAATAPRADIWMALEYTGRWGRRAFEESDLDQAVKTHLEAFGKATPHARIQFIKQAGRSSVSAPRVYMAVSNAETPRLYAFDLPNYAALTGLDLDALATGDPAYDDHLSDEKLFLVCVNGLRDACCAKFGLPVYDAFAEQAGAAAWQSTHHGGHRLAPNVLLFPDGLSYGRVTPDDAPAVVERYRAGELILERLRGRTTLSQPAQAAEHALRAETGWRGVDATRLIGEETLGEGLTRVTLAGEDGVERVFRVEAETFAEPVFKSCTDEEPSPVVHYHARAESPA